jgi:hypothetical protein
MQSNFLVVLFKNKNRHKIIKKFVTKDRCNTFFKTYISKNDDLYFPLIYENGQKVKYEIALLEKDGSINYIIQRDSLGRIIDSTISDSDYAINKIEPYFFPEEVYDIKTKVKRTFLEVITVESKTKDLKSVFKLNNKVVFQNDEKINVYSCKSNEESKRFLDELQKYCVNKKRGDFLISQADDSATKKQLYDVLVKNGFDKKMLYRQFTTYPKDK